MNRYRKLPTEPGRFNFDLYTPETIQNRSIRWIAATAHRPRALSHTQWGTN